MKKVEIFTDGACSGNPGPGGWAAILKYKDAEGNLHKKEISGGDPLTTNNQMELTAVIKGLQILKEPCEVTLYSDSQYVVNAFNADWIKSWVLHNWKKSNGEKVKNVEMWKTLLELCKKHKVFYVWVKGHNGHPENERCDKLAVIQRDLYSRK